MTFSSVDIALPKFERFMNEYEAFKTQDINESDTRSKMIDVILKDILGWTEFDIEREEKVDSGFYDYRVSTSDFAFIVEAKRNFKDFELPDKGRYVSFNSLLKGNNEVINQIRDYIIDKSLAFGVITNGHQFIIGQFLNTSGKDWRQNKAIIYRSLEEIHKNFLEFYKFLSKESVLVNKQIKIKLPVPTPHILVNILKGSNQTLVRNEFSAELSSVILKAFGELKHSSKEHEKNLLKYCYVKNDDVKKYNSELDLALFDNPPSIDNKIVKARNTSSIQNQIKGKIFDNDDVASTPPLMIIIGGKGVGKTTFIKNFFEIELSGKAKTNRPSVYLDFRGYTEQDIKDSKSICGRIIQSLQDDYPSLKLSSLGTLEQIYKKDILDKKSNIWNHLLNNKDKLRDKISNFLEDSLKNSTEHLIKLSVYLNNHCYKHLSIIFDNADQLSDEAQKESFLLAESLHQKLNCITIISLREGYYNRWKNKPPFDAFHSTVFHISAPPYREVLKKRLEYINQHIHFKQIKGEYKGKSIELTQENFKNLFSNLQHTLFGKSSSEVLNLLEETSFPNIRLGIEKLSKFLVSGHTNIRSYILTDRYNIPIWEFIKSIALDSSKFYHSIESLVFNLFYPCQGNNNHFTKIRILDFLYSECGKQIHVEKFIPVKEIIDVFKVGGYSEEIVLKELTVLLNLILIDNQMISSDIDTDGIITGSSHVKITYSGGYYLNKMISMFSYLELVLQDCPIYDENYFKKIKSSFPEKDKHKKADLSKRLDTVDYFCNYLKEQELMDHERTLQEEIHSCLRRNIMTEIVCNESYNHDVNRIRLKIKSNESQP